MTSLCSELGLGKNGVISLIGAGGKTSMMLRLAREFSTSGETVLTTTTTRIYPPSDPSECLIVSDSPVEILNRARKLLKYTPHISAAARQVSPHGKLIGFAPETIDLFRKSNLFRWIIVEADGAAGRPLKAPAPHEPVVPDCTNWAIGIVGLSALGRPLDAHTVFRPELVSKITGLAEGKEITGKAICDLLLHRQGTFQGTPMGARKMAFLNQADIPRKAQAGRSIIQYLARKKPMDISRVILGSISLEAPVFECRDLHHPLS